MSRYAIAWIVGAIGVLGLGATAVWLGFTIMPTVGRAREVGTLVPWFVTWGFIWLTTLISIVLARTLLRVGLSRTS